MKRELKPGDIVCNFKRETVREKGNKYLYKICAFATHSETMEKMVVYEALYEPFGTWVRPYDMFMSKVDKEKYPDINQEYRFELIAY